MEPHIYITAVTVQNVWYHGITLSALTGRNFGPRPDFPPALGGNVYGNTVDAAGVGIASNAYGNRTWDSSAAARNDTTYSFNTVTNPVVAAYRMEFLSGGDEDVDAAADVDDDLLATLASNW
jgi:hypothetical protein